VKLESGRQVANLESQLSAKVESFTKLETEKEILIQDRDVLRSRLETVILRLNEAKSETAQVEEAYKQEIQAQTNFAEIYKRKSQLLDPVCVIILYKKK
jgi:DNA repair exonuclease SbcCD ATPase subunit